jgi:hypothetical protein
MFILDLLVLKNPRFVGKDPSFSVATTGGIAWVCPTMGEAFSIHQLLVHHQV